MFPHVVGKCVNECGLYVLEFPTCCAFIPANVFTIICTHTRTHTCTHTHNYAHSHTHIHIYAPMYTPPTHTQNGGIPHTWPHLTVATGQPFALTAFALSLLLVFRTNTSYDRYVCVVWISPTYTHTTHHPPHHPHTTPHPQQVVGGTQAVRWHAQSQHRFCEAGHVVVP